MGHERLGSLPKTRHWVDIVQRLATTQSNPSRVARLAADTLKRVEGAYTKLHMDQGVQTAFKYLIVFSTVQPQPTLRSATETHEEPGTLSALEIARAVQASVRPRLQSFELGELAIRAATAAILNWYADQAKRPALFPADDQWAFQRPRGGGAFSELSRYFFANLTARLLMYVLSREASGAITDLPGRNRFQHQLFDQLDLASRTSLRDMATVLPDSVMLYTLETAKITQSFAAGWFTKRLSEHQFPDVDISAFLRIGFGKLQEELARESERG